VEENLISRSAPERFWSSGRLSRLFPPARLLWIFLAVLGAYGSNFLHGLGETTLLVLPAVAALSDLAFQTVRFPRLRFPDAALATGLFLALILPPTVSLVLSGAATFVAIIVRHALRFRGRPWLNPAIFGVFLGTVVLGLAPAWWVSVGADGEFLMVGMGLALLARTPRAWRLPVAFFVSYGLLTAAAHLVIGAALDSHVLLLEVIDPATVFFGLFIVVEPRTAPVDGATQALYAAGVGLGTALLPLEFPSVGILIALLAANFGMVAVRYAQSVADTPSRGSVSRAGAKTGKRRVRAERPVRWPVAYRVSACVFALVVLVAALALSPVSHPQPLFAISRGSGSGGGGGGGGSGGGPPLTNCTKDNPGISASTLASLHSTLGPSVILSYNGNTGLVVFFDPVNFVTVTESDLYEDFGYAEFNGDDYPVSGCHP
jgi:Na+-translocating ferredoxin:NAD+ oxidoreductase RnfD subunit